MKTNPLTSQTPNRGNTGKLHTAETKEKMAAAKRGIPKSPEHKAKLPMRQGISLFAGRHHTEETREKLSQIAKARVPKLRLCDICKAKLTK